METSQTSSREASTENEGQSPGARDVLRGIARRRIDRRRHQVARNVKGRVRAFGRGARFGYAIQENPGRSVVLGFALGCVVGAVGLALSQMVQDFQQLIEEESPSEGISGEAEAAAA